MSTDIMAELVAELRTLEVAPDMIDGLVSAVEACKVAILREASSSAFYIGQPEVRHGPQGQQAVFYEHLVPVTVWAEMTLLPS